jgi:LPXTG-site transpeptidase (sortase) family protein
MQVPRTSVVLNPQRLLPKRARLVLKSAPWRISNNRRQVKQPRARISRRRLVLSYSLLLIGGSLCTYVAGTYAWMYAEQLKLLHRWKTQSTSALANDRALTKLSIPRVRLRAIVLEGTSRHLLLLGPGHMADSAVPGTIGNAVIAGHRDTFFRHIDRLRHGDEIYVLKGGKQFRYVVIDKKVVESDDLSVLRATKDGELTLITCYPTHAIGPAPRRLIVVAKLVAAT